MERFCYLGGGINVYLDKPFRKCQKPHSKVYISLPTWLRCVIMLAQEAMKDEHVYRWGVYQLKERTTPA